MVVLLLILEFVTHRATVPSEAAFSPGTQILSLTGAPPSITSHVPSLSETVYLLQEHIRILSETSVYPCEEVGKIVEEAELVMLLSFSLVKLDTADQVIWLFNSPTYQNLWQPDGDSVYVPLKVIIESLVDETIHRCGAEELEPLKATCDKFLQLADQLSRVSSAQPSSDFVSQLVDSVFLSSVPAFDPETVTFRWITDQIYTYLFLEVTDTDDSWRESVLSFAASSAFRGLMVKDSFALIRSLDDSINQFLKNVDSDDESILAGPPIEVKTSTDVSVGGMGAPAGPRTPGQYVPKGVFGRPTKSARGKHKPESSPEEYSSPSKS